MSRSTAANIRVRRLSARALFSATLFGLAVLAAPEAVSAAQMPNADQLRREGRACEQPDGYLRALSPDARAAVEQINAQRRNFYQQRATQERVDAVAVAVVYAEEIKKQPDYRACQN
jgi:uncharacterized protein YdbL (DUF1318 family)